SHCFLHPPPSPPLLPYTTLFRSPFAAAAVAHQHLHGIEPGVDRGRIDQGREEPAAQQPAPHGRQGAVDDREQRGAFCAGAEWLEDRKSTRLNSSHVSISYAVFCL